MAAKSHARAAAATNSGRFKDEIVPVETTWKDPKTGEEKKIVVDKDDGIREGVTAGQLSKLPAVFKKGGSTTAGNSSQVSFQTIIHSDQKWLTAWQRSNQLSKTICSPLFLLQEYQ